MKKNAGQNLVAINEALSPEQSKEADRAYQKLAEKQKNSLEEIATKLEKRAPLTAYEADFAAAILRGTEIRDKRKKPKGGKKVPDEALLLRQVYINDGMAPEEADKALALLYGVDQETFERQMNRLRKRIDLEAWGLTDSKPDK